MLTDVKYRLAYAVVRNDLHGRAVRRLCQGTVVVYQDYSEACEAAMDLAEEACACLVNAEYVAYGSVTVLDCEDGMIVASYPFRRNP